MDHQPDADEQQQQVSTHESRRRESPRRRTGSESHAPADEIPSWGDAHRGESRPDRRKFIDTTTPTLIDEEEDVLEEEIVSLGAAARRVAPSYAESMRRTPGATAMHSSASRHTSVSVTDSALLGFGLTLSTPVAVPEKEDSVSSSSSMQEEAAPRSYTPAGWILGKNPHLEVGRGAFSPNTLRLTEDLDNLLLDEDDGQVFRQQDDDDDKKEAQESWTSSYIFDSAAAQLKKKKPSRKGGRRSRGGGGPNRPNFRIESPAEEEEPRPLNFGGAFVPPAGGHAPNFRRPVPSAAPPAGALSTTSSLKGPPPQMNIGQMQQGGFRPPAATTSFPQFSTTASGFHSQQAPPPPPPPPSYSVYGASAAARGFQQGLNPYAAAAAAASMDAAQQASYAASMPPPPPQQPTQYPLQPPQQSWSQPMMPPPPPMNYNPGGGGMNPRAAAWTTTSTASMVPPPDYGPYGGMDTRMHLTPSPQYPPPWQQQQQQTEARFNYPSQQQQMSGGFHAPPPDFSMGVAPDSRGGGTTKKEARRGGGRKKGDNKQAARGRDTKKGDAVQQQQRKRGSTSPRKKKGKPQQARKEDDTVGSEDPRLEMLDENPAARAAYKEFYREFRAKERTSFQAAEDFARTTLESNDKLPKTVHWRVHLELADLAKRSNRIVEARQLYRQVCELQPYASQGWLEYSKLEEECGHLNRCARILHNGLQYCEYSESLLTRAIKHAEKMGKLDMGRQLLARLKHVGIEKVWRTVLEGAMLEARAGNALMARRVLKYLMHHVPWYGPLYLEAYRLERDLGRLDEALAIVEKGLTAIPRYGPLWFGAFRLCEALDTADKAYHMPRTTSMLSRATHNISRELVWKIHLDAAQILERAAIKKCSENTHLILDEQLKLCRQRFAMTAMTCPPNLCWKVWLASGRMELSAGNPKRARDLFLRAQQVVPEKGRAAALLECARLEEFVGNPTLARAILAQSRFELVSDWKVWLESVLLEVRGGFRYRAIDLARRALDAHSGTGRLWACLVQLRQCDGGEEAQFSSLKRALRAVPKSGEVWCEGGRIHLNPFSNTFDLTEARRHLFFATRFTPQYGDSFLESMKMELLEQWIGPIALNMWQVLQPDFLETISECSDEDSDEALASVVQNAARQVLHALASEQTEQDKEDEDDDNNNEGDDDDDKKLRSLLRGALTTKAAYEALDNSELLRRCANADPNYGLLWFHCRNGPIDTARTIISRGREIMIGEVTSFAHLYIAAMVRRFAIITTLRYHNQKKKAAEVDEHGLDELEALLDSRLRAAPSIEQMLGASDTVLLESSVSGTDFVTGLVELNKPKPLLGLSLSARRKALFGSDALFS